MFELENNEKLHQTILELDSLDLLEARYKDEKQQIIKQKLEQRISSYLKTSLDFYTKESPPVKLREPVELINVIGLFGGVMRSLNQEYLDNKRIAPVPTRDSDGQRIYSIYFVPALTPESAQKIVKVNVEKAFQTYEAEAMPHNLMILASTHDR